MEDWTELSSESFAHFSFFFQLTNPMWHNIDLYVGKSEAKGQKNGKKRKKKTIFFLTLHLINIPTNRIEK
jgi:hypothetical protein